MKTRRRTAAVAATAAVAQSAVGLTAVELTPASAAAVAHTSPRLVATGGVTMLALDAGTAKALTANSIKVAPASEARVVASGIAFPIQGGVLNPATLGGTLTHDGGLTFTAGGKSLTIRDFTVSTTTGRLSAYVDEVGARINVLDLSLAKAKVAASTGKLGVSGVVATLDATAAKALDGYFGTKLFTKGLAIGTVRVSAKVGVVYK
jgi:hypothetical protein